LGKRNTKNSEADYVQRAWRTVFADSLSKDINWLGRRDKRVNNGNGKKDCSIVVSRKLLKVSKPEIVVDHVQIYLII
jgi:hypothetical protein